MGAVSVDARALPLSGMPDYSHETRLLATMTGPLAGIDEVGRGPLAGPVVAAAVILDKARIPDGLNDSKKLSAKKREALFDIIIECATVGIGQASVEEIDAINIRQATHLAMKRAIAELATQPAIALIDGKDAPPLTCACETLIGGDGLSVSIAAASIIAKVTRDRMMVELHDDHPDYGWNSNMGYGTAAHLAALNRLGATIHHRRSFAPIHKILRSANPAESNL